MRERERKSEGEREGGREGGREGERKMRMRIGLVGSSGHLFENMLEQVQNTSLSE